MSAQLRRCASTLTHKFPSNSATITFDLNCNDRVNMDFLKPSMRVMLREGNRLVEARRLCLSGFDVSFNQIV